MLTPGGTVCLDYICKNILLASPGRGFYRKSILSFWSFWALKKKKGRLFEKDKFLAYKLNGTSIMEPPKLFSLK